MRFGVLVALFVFVGLFILFWNIKKWKWSVAKMAAVAGVAATAAGVVVSGLIYFLILLG